MTRIPVQRWPRAQSAAVVALALWVALAAGIAACNPISRRVTRLDHQSYPVPNGGHTSLSVTTFNGRVSVTAAGEGKADVSVTAYGTGGGDADAQAALDAVKVSMSQAGERLVITAQPDGNGPLAATRGADIDVMLPPNSDVTLTTSNGRIEAVNVRGSIVAQTSNGEIVTRAGRNVQAETSNAAVTAVHPTGGLSVRTSNAAVDILNAEAVIADVRSSNAPISFSGSLAGGDHAFVTTNARIDLRLPVWQGFSVLDHGSDTTVTTDFSDLTAARGNLSGQTGDGRAAITVETSNAALSIRRLTP